MNDEAEKIKKQFADLHFNVTYKEAKTLLTEEEFLVFDKGCLAATVASRAQRSPTLLEQLDIDEMFRLRKIAADRKSR